MTLFLAVLVAGLTAVAVGQTPNSKVADVTNFKKLRSWGESSLYEIEASNTYTTNPYLIHLIGTKYGQSSISQHDIVMYVCVWCCEALIPEAGANRDVASQLPFSC